MKRYFVNILCALMLISCLFVFTSCKHECVFEQGFIHDGTYHWHECNEDYCEEQIDVSPHEFENGYCKVCNKQSRYFVTALQWEDALDLFEENFVLEYCLIKEEGQVEYTVKRLNSNVFVKDENENEYYFTKEEDMYYRYDLDGETWERTEADETVIQPYLTIDFNRFAYEWFIYYQEDSRYVARWVDGALLGETADVEGGVATFWEGKLTSLMFKMVDGKSVEEHKINISYENVSLDLPKVLIEDEME